MGRVNAFGRMWNDNGRDVSVGGRGQSDRISANLNTDNAGGSDCHLFATAEVVGEKQVGGKPMRKLCDNCNYPWANDKQRECPVCKKERQGIDTRCTIFTVELPEPSEYCHVRIREHDASLKDIAAFGAVLAGMKYGDKLASPDPSEVERAEDIFKFIDDTLKSLQTQMDELPKTTLPGGVDMHHALACVHIVETLMRSQDNDPRLSSSGSN